MRVCLVVVLWGAWVVAGETTWKTFYHSHCCGGSQYGKDNKGVYNGIHGSSSLEATTANSRIAMSLSGVSGTVYSNNWMSHLKYDTQLRDLNLPGTHDTMSFWHSWSSSKMYYASDVASYHTCHNANLRNQLDSGIRFLDLRLGNKDGVMTSRHAFSNMRLELDVVLATLKEFLDANPREVVFVRVKKEGNTDHTDNTFAFILESYIRGERYLRKVGSSSSRSGYASCVWREVAWPNADHYWCRKSGNSVNVDGATRTDKYHASYTDYVYVHDPKRPLSTINTADTKRLSLVSILGGSPNHGKVVLLKDFTDDEFHTGKGKADPNACGGNTYPTSEGQNHCTRFAQMVYGGSSEFAIQDQFEPGGYLQKLEYVSAHLESARTRGDGRVYLNFLSANEATSGRDPRDFAQYVSPSAHSLLTGSSGYAGVVMMDFPGEDLIKAVVERNVVSATTETLTGVCLQAHNGQYVASESNVEDINANRDGCGTWETHKIVDHNGGSLVHGDLVSVLTYHGRFWSAKPSGDLEGDTPVAQSYERFYVYRHAGSGTVSAGDQISLKSFAHNKYVAAEGGGGRELTCNRDQANSWERFTVSFSSRW